MAKRRDQPAQPFVGTLTQEDFAVLRLLVSEFKSKRINSQLHSQIQYDHQAPEVYVGITLSEIPALTNQPTHTGTGSGTGAEGDVAGKGNCRLVRIMKSDDTLDRLPTKVEAFNISGSAIPKNQEVLLARDKFGNWLVVVGGSSEYPHIRFRISENWQADIDCIHGTAVATVTHRSLGATTPAIGSEVLLCDMDGCFLNGPPVFLAERTGWAEQLEGEGICTPEGYNSDLEVWCIFSMCSADYRCT